MDIPEVVDDYCDHNHRVRVWGSVLFKLVKQSVAVNKGLKNKDCEQLKINFAYWLHLYKDESLPEMKRRAKAIVAHHFNLHTWCGTWCKWSPEHDKVPIQSPNNRKKYRCVSKHKEMFDLCNSKLEPYLQDDKLIQCRHKYSTQNNEAIHKITKFQGHGHK